ncbi:MAG: lipopolysaccharide biosynthesis protein [Oscillospiraceae bacterium]|nr:lipopolysaccharide biosynthesis protein [Oscillospiraceae bacterium]
MNKKSSLGKNILIFGLGTSLSKLMSVLLIGLYTAYISTEDYGYYDILFTVISLMTPLVTLQITDALYRHLLDSRGDGDANRSVTNAFAVVAAGLGLAVAAFLAVNALADVRFGGILPGYMVTSVMLVFSQQTARGLRRNAVYAVSGVVYTGVMMAANILMIVTLGFGVEALLYSTMIADVVAVLLIERTVGVFRRLRLSHFSFGQIQSMCRYSVPLLPGALMWWLLLLVSRAVISQTLGTSYNGIYAVSAKFPGLLIVVFSIFGLAWQESAITEYDSEHRNEYYTKTFNLYMRLLLSSMLILFSVTRSATMVLIGEEFSSAWRYIPFLYIGSIFSAFSQFYGTGYLSAKKTLGSFMTTFIGVGCGFLCLFLVPVWGLQAAALAQMAAYIMVFLTRLVHTRKFFRIRIELPALFILSALTVLFTYGYYLADMRVEIAMLALALVIFFAMNRKFIRRLFDMAVSALRKQEG